ncbi:unnamed protein product [Symbiodinium sp. CCMP2592]|nr:unnamed protein product [Symbiodinium sp. CCMP2592]
MSRNASLVPLEASSARLDFQLGGVDENGWYSKNGALARRSQESDSERQLFSKASSIQQAFVDHVEAGRLERVEDMLEFRSDEFDLNFQDPVHGRTPLMLAALAGSLELVEVLLEARADPHIRERTEMRYTPLEAAQVIMEDEDGDFEEIVQALAKASGYDRPPPRRSDPGYDFR